MHGHDHDERTLAPDPRTPGPLPRFNVVRRGYEPLQVDRWVAEVARGVGELTTEAELAQRRLAEAEARAVAAEQRAAEAERLAAEQLEAAEQRAARAGDRASAAEARAALASSRGATSRLDEALKAVLEEAGRVTDAVLAEARARVVQLVDAAERQSELVLADATVQGELVAAQRREEVDRALAHRIAEQERLAGEVEVLRTAQRIATGSARSVLDQLGAVAATLDPDPRRAPGDEVVIDLTDGADPDGLSTSVEGAERGPLAG